MFVTRQKGTIFLNFVLSYLYINHHIKLSDTNFYAEKNITNDFMNNYSHVQNIRSNKL